MTLRIRKSIKIIPGVRLNLGKKGASVSVGGRGATVNISKKGTRTTVGIPGSGISHSTYTPHASTAKNETTTNTTVPNETAPIIEMAKSKGFFASLTFSNCLILLIAVMVISGIGDGILLHTAAFFPWSVTLSLITVALFAMTVIKGIGALLRPKPSGTLGAAPAAPTQAMQFRNPANGYSEATAKGGAMKGTILDFTIQTNTGIISGDDGRRYSFAGAEWKDTAHPVKGMVVDFEPLDNQAASIYVLSTAHQSSTIISGHQRPPEYQRYYKSSDEGTVAGICAGLAHKWNFNRTGLRIIFFLIYPLWIVYFILWCVLKGLPTKNVKFAE